MEQWTLIVVAKDDTQAHAIANAMETILNKDELSFCWTIRVGNNENNHYDFLISRIRKGDFAWQ